MSFLISDPRRRHDAYHGSYNGHMHGLSHDRDQVRHRPDHRHPDAADPEEQAGGHCNSDIEHTWPGIHHDASRDVGR